MKNTDKTIKYVPNVFRIIFYIILYGIFGILSFMFFRSYIGILLIVVLTVLPAVSISQLIYAANRMEFNIYVSDNEAREISCGIRINNKSIYSFLKAVLTVRVDNSYYDLTNDLNNVIAINSHDNPINLDFEVSQCGKLHIILDKASVYDNMGLIKAKFDLGMEAVIDVMPVVREDEESVFTGLLMGMSDNEDDSKTGNEYSDTSNIREYIPGDRIKDIHWKLSAKKDNLLVRERIKSCENRMVIMLDSSDNAKLNDDILALYYSICRFCIKEGVLVKTIIFDSLLNDYKEYTALNFEELNRTVSLIYNCRAVNHICDTNMISGNCIRVGYINGQVNYLIYEGFDA